MQHVSSIGTNPARIIFGNSVDLDSGLILQIDKDTTSSEQKKTLRMSEWINMMSELQNDCIRKQKSKMNISIIIEMRI